MTTRIIPNPNSICNRTSSDLAPSACMAKCDSMPRRTIRITLARFLISLCSRRQIEGESNMRWQRHVRGADRPRPARPGGLRKAPRLKIRREIRGRGNTGTGAIFSIFSLTAKSAPDRVCYVAFPAIGLAINEEKGILLLFPHSIHTHSNILRAYQGCNAARASAGILAMMLR